MKRSLFALLALTCYASAAVMLTAPGPREDRTPASIELERCLGDSMPMATSHGSPYVELPIQGRRGWFVVDTGATGSNLDLNAWKDAGIPSPRTAFLCDSAFCRPKGFEFFGRWDSVQFREADYSGIRGDFRQAGLLGTDFLALNVFSFHYRSGKLFRAKTASFCSDRILRQAGLRPLSTAGYYSNYAMTQGYLNVPTVPLRLGEVKFVAQIDTGFGDSVDRFSININAALKKRFDAAGIRLVPNPSRNGFLSTCVPGVFDTIAAYRLPAGESIEWIGMNGEPVRVDSQANFFLKTTLPAAKHCGGISTWDSPAAQLGASFFEDAGLVIYDPFTSRVWM